MVDWIKDNFGNNGIKPKLILMVYINRVKVISYIDESSVLLNNYMLNEHRILVDSYNIVIDNILSVFTTHFNQSDNVGMIKDICDNIYINIIDELINRYLITSIFVNKELLIQDIYKIYKYICSRIAINASKVKMHNIQNIYEISSIKDLTYGSYIYDITNDTIKIVELGFEK